MCPVLHHQPAELTPSSALKSAEKSGSRAEGGPLGRFMADGLCCRAAHNITPVLFLSYVRVATELHDPRALDTCRVFQNHECNTLKLCIHAFFDLVLFCKQTVKVRELFTPVRQPGGIVLKLRRYAYLYFLT